MCLLKKLNFRIYLYTFNFIVNKILFTLLLLFYEKQTSITKEINESQSSKMKSKLQSNLEQIKKSIKKCSKKTFCSQIS